MKTKLLLAGGLLAALAAPTWGELVMHLDADSLSLADGAAVTSWTDLSGNENHAVQESTDSAPVYVSSSTNYNNHACVQFSTNSTTSLDLDETMINVGSFTLFLVGKFDSDSSTSYLIGGQSGGGDNRLRIASYSGGIQARVGNVPEFKLLNYRSTNTHFYALTSAPDGWADGSFVDGGENTSTNVPFALNLGSYADLSKDYLEGSIAEVRLYDTVLTAEEIESINAELAIKYDLGDESIWITEQTPGNGAVVTAEDFPVTIGAKLRDVHDEVDTSTVQLLLNGNNILEPGDVVSSAPLTTVGHEYSSLGEGTYTADLVYSNTAATVGYTNSWTFQVIGAPNARVFVDANTSNTEIWDGTGFTAWDGASGWTARSTFGVGGEIYQSDYAADSPRLKTTVSVEYGAYKLYAYMWVNFADDWRIGASDTNSTEELPVYKMSDYPSAGMSVPYVEFAGGGITDRPVNPDPCSSTNLSVNPFGTENIVVAEADRKLVEIYVGTVVASELSVYVDDDITGTTHAERTWFDGIGYEKVGATFDPVIESIVMANGSVTLRWTSEATGIYTILQKTDLQHNSEWTTNATDISGMEPTTSYTFPVDGSTDQKFFKVDGI